MSELTKMVDDLVEQGKPKKVMDDSGNWTGLVQITQKGVDYVEENFADDPRVKEIMESKKK